MSKGKAMQAQTEDEPNNVMTLPVAAAPEAIPMETVSGQTNAPTPPAAIPEPAPAQSEPSPDLNNAQVFSNDMRLALARFDQKIAEQRARRDAAVERYNEQRAELDEKHAKELTSIDSFIEDLAICKEGAENALSAMERRGSNGGEQENQQ